MGYFEEFGIEAWPNNGLMWEAKFWVRMVMEINERVGKDCGNVAWWTIWGFFY